MTARDQFDRDVEAMRQAYLRTHPEDPIAKLAAAVSAAHTRPRLQADDAWKTAAAAKQQLADLESQGRSRGQFPDGRRVPVEFKRQAYSNYLAVQAAHRERLAAENRSQVPIMNSMDEPSPGIRRLFGLD